MKKLQRVIGIVSITLGVTAVMQQLKRPSEERDWQGNVACVPYDLRPPTLSRVRERWWNPEDPRLFTPHVFGVGWSVNLHRLTRMCCAGEEEDRAA